MARDDQGFYTGRVRPASPPIPITVVTGALGAGKTTLVNRLLSEEHGLRLAVVINEFGSVGIDADLVAHADEDLVEMNNGCVCCQLRTDLVEALERLTARDQALDAVVVETSGVANPQPLVRTFIVEPSVKRRYRVDGVVTLVDALHFDRQLHDQPATRQQISWADVMLLNKADAVDAGTLDDIAGRLRALNPVAPIRPCRFAEAPVVTLFGLDTFGAERAEEVEPELHHADLETVSAVVEGSLDDRRASMWLGMVIATHGEGLYRCKGVLDIAGRDDRVVFHGVYRHLDTYPGLAWGDGPRQTKCVFIGRDLDRALLTTGLEDCRV